MGRQIQFHLLEQDCSGLLQFIQERDPVLAMKRDGESEVPEIITEPCRSRETLCLWNQSLLHSIKRKYIPESNKGPYYRIDSKLPVLEFWLPRKTEWNGKPALTQGRIWVDLLEKNTPVESWYNRIVRWIRRHYASASVVELQGYIGPGAWEWFKKGGVLLPIFRPPVTRDWEEFFARQDRVRNLHDNEL